MENKLSHWKVVCIPLKMEFFCIEIAISDWMEEFHVNLKFQCHELTKVAKFFKLHLLISLDNSHSWHWPLHSSHNDWIVIELTKTQRKMKRKTFGRAIRQLKAFYNDICISKWQSDQIHSWDARSLDETTSIKVLRNTQWINIIHCLKSKKAMKVPRIWINWRSQVLIRIIFSNAIGLNIVFLVHICSIKLIIFNLQLNRVVPMPTLRYLNR